MFFNDFGEREAWYFTTLQPSQLINVAQEQFCSYVIWIFTEVKFERSLINQEFSNGLTYYL